MAVTPSASYSLTLRIQLENEPGTLGDVTSAIGDAGGSVGAIDIVKAEGGKLVRDITVDARSQEHWDQILAAVRDVEGVDLLDVTDRTFNMHEGGKIEQLNKHPLKNRDDLSMAYTPGVARVCRAIHEDPELAFRYTLKRNYVAVVSDGSAVLGLGDIGPRAAMPVMEGKAMLLKEFGGVDAFPICLDTKDPDEIVATVKAIAPGFGGINLEDISSPRCFEIEDRLKEELDIPVFHDDQHGTAVVVMAALFNGLKITGKRLEDLHVAMVGLGAAGIAVTRMLLQVGRARDHRVRHPRRDLRRSRRLGRDAPAEALVRRADQLGAPPRRPRRRRRRRGPVHRPLGPGRDRGAGPRAHERRRDGVRDGQPGARGDARGGRSVRADRGDRALGLPEPDQQRAVLPRPVPRCAGRSSGGDHRGDEAGGRLRRSPR